MTSPQVENKAKSKTSGLETAKVKTSGDDAKEVEEEKSLVKGEEEQDEKAKSDDEDAGPDDEKEEKEEEKLSKDISKSNSVERIKILEKEAPDKKVLDNEKVSDNETVDKSTQKSAKLEGNEKDGPEDSTPAGKEETKEVAKEEEEKQQGVKRRVEEEAGGTSRKVVRQSDSVSRVADMELLASLSSSQPGLLKREREEEEEQEQEGEPDSKKSNTVEEEVKGVQEVEKKEVGKRKEKVEVSEVKKGEKKVEKVDEAPVVASTKLKDAALEASFSSSRSRHKVEEPVETLEEQSFQEIMPQNLTSTMPLPVPIIPPSPTSLFTPSDPPAEPSVRKKESSSSPTFKETKQIIGAKELQNEKALQRKRLNKMLTIFEDQTTVKVAVDKQIKTQKFEDSLKVLENQNKLKEPPPFATTLPRLPSYDEAM